MEDVDSVDFLGETRFRLFDVGSFSPSWKIADAASPAANIRERAWARFVFVASEVVIVNNYLTASSMSVFTQVLYKS